jgi:Hereditary spastic paraplegia protein strumpellin.
MFHTVGSDICSMTVQRSYLSAFMTALSLFITLLTDIHQQYVGHALSHLHGNSGNVNMPQCCVIRTLPSFLCLTLFLNNLQIDTLKFSNNIALVTSISSLIFRTTVYIEHMTAWYDLKTRNEVINLKFFSKITKSVGTAGLTGLDRLFSFMIVTELQVCFMNSHMLHFTRNCVFLNPVRFVLLVDRSALKALQYCVL